MTDVKNALKQKNNNKAEKKETGMQAILSKMGDQIAIALPNEMSSDRFKRVALTAFNGNKTLQQCEPISFIASMMQSAQLGLEPNTPLGEAYLIPYGKKVQFQVGYQGLLNLAYRSGEYQSIVAREVCENDEFELDYGSESIKHIPNLRGERGEVYGYYSKYVRKDGGKGIFYMSKEEAKKYGMAFSKTFNNGPWKTNFDAMAKKTCIKQLLKYAPKSIESEKLSQAMNSDETKINDFRIDKNTKRVDFDYDYEVVTDEIPKNIDKETGEIIENENIEVDNQGDFFDEDFKPLEV